MLRNDSFGGHIAIYSDYRDRNLVIFVLLTEFIPMKRTVLLVFLVFVYTIAYNQYRHAKTLVYGILDLQSITWNLGENLNHPRWLNPTMELITYFFVVWLQHGRHCVKCKPSIMKSSHFHRKCTSHA